MFGFALGISKKYLETDKDVRCGIVYVTLLPGALLTPQ